MNKSLFVPVSTFLWWFGDGAKAVLGWAKAKVDLLLYGMSLRLLWQNLFQPLYGLTKFYDRWISVLVRLGHVVLLSAAAAVASALIFGVFVAYLLVPFSLLLLFANPAIAAGIYAAMVVLYLGFRDSTRSPLRQRIRKRLPKNILPYADKKVQQLFGSEEKPLEEVISHLVKTSEAKAFFARLEEPSPDGSEFRIIFDRKNLLKESLRYARSKDKTQITTIDVLYALWFLTKEEVFWEQFGVNYQQMEDLFETSLLRQTLGKYQKRWALYSAFQKQNNVNKGLTSPLSKRLNEISRPFVSRKQAHEITPLMGREKEYHQILNTLSNPGGAILLIGPSGSGKTRIIEHLAENLAIDSVPRCLRDNTLLELDVGRMLSGDAVNNDKEGGKNFITILDEVSQAHHIILSIDNLAALGGDNQAQASNFGILSRYLETHKVRLIATTSEADYDRVLRKNPSHLRYFTQIHIDGLEEDELLNALRYQAINLEQKHRILVGPKCFTSLVDISRKVVGSLANPAKSLVLLEEAIIANTGKSFLTSEDIKAVVAKNTGIRITKVDEAERQLLNNLEDEIHKTIVGQDHAVKKIADSIRRARLDLHDYNGPIARFMFVGPTGVGKTELAKTVARIYFNSEEKMLRLDMSEFRNIDDIKRLIGDEQTPGLLTSPIENTPHMLVLLDEIEKAHPDILNLFLHVLDDGKMKDGKGRLIDFRNTIIIATSNVGASHILEGIRNKVPFPSIAENLKKNILFEHFRPEFVNRFSDILIFEPLPKANVVMIAEKLLRRNQQMLRAKGIEIDFTPDAFQVIAEQAYNPEMGARPLRNMITERLESGVAKVMLSGESGGNKIIRFNGETLERV